MKHETLEWWGGPKDGGTLEAEKPDNIDVITSVDTNITPEEANDERVKRISRFRFPVEPKKGKMYVIWHQRVLLQTEPS